MSCPEEFREVVYQKNDGQYRIRFLERTIEEGDSIYCYEVRVTKTPALSFWILELCIEPPHEVLEIRVDGKIVEEEEYEILLDPPDPLTGISGIKFEIEIDEDISPLTFCIKLAGIFQIEPVDIGVKAGAPPALTGEKICGPSCSPFTPIPPLRRGLTI